MKSPFRVKSVEYHSVYGDGDDLNDDLDEGAYKGPVLELDVNIEVRDMGRTALTCMRQIRA